MATEMVENTMRARLLASAAAIAMATSPAFAADLYTPTYVPPISDPVYSTGPSVVGHLSLGIGLVNIGDVIGEEEFSFDDTVGVFTGAGRGFCAGADLRQGGRDRFRKKSLQRDGGGRLTLRLYECLKPVICACNGPAVGIGATMQCAMDVRLASTDARFGFVFSCSAAS